MDAIEQKFYEVAAEELANKRPVVALMAKAFSDADGDERKTNARYIKMRVAQLATEYSEQLARNQRAAKEEHEKTVKEEAQRRARDEEKAKEGKIVARGNLCGRCRYFTAKGILDRFVGHCSKHDSRTYRNFGCTLFLQR